MSASTIVNYQILSSSRGLRHLESRVKAALKQAWQPLGGVCVATEYEGSFHFYQAMVRMKMPEEIHGGRIGVPEPAVPDPTQD